MKGHGILLPCWFIVAAGSGATCDLGTLGVDDTTEDGGTHGDDSSGPEDEEAHGDGGTDANETGGSGSDEPVGSSGSDDDGPSTDGESAGLDPPAGDVIPQPTAPCPMITDGVVSFCPAGLDTCRGALVVNADAATGDGPLSLHWHGTFETPDGIMAWDSAAQAVEAMVVAEGGVMVLPYADPGAPTRPGTPFPWWIVCGASGTQCDRLDDFVLADEIVGCAIDQGLADPSRVTSSGMSAGGIMTSYLVARTRYLAAAVSWSGGVPLFALPVVPPNETAVMVLHGGPTDLYCGLGAPGGCYDFVPPSEAFAANLVQEGSFSFLCDHQAGHTTAMGQQGAQFLSLANRAGHPWHGYSFGTGGDWMLDHYCYLPGQPSPWAATP